MMNIHEKEITYTPKRNISCAGTDELTDHPTVYLQIDEQVREISCPYCNKIFKLTI